MSYVRLMATASLCFTAIAVAADETDAPLPPDQAARTMVVPDGFNVTLFAGEPEVRQPIGFCIDDRGRLWVAEAYNYPRHQATGRDRIVIFEDVDGNGHFDQRTVFYDKLNYVTGIEVGFGGAWVMSPPSFFFIPDKNRDDQPDSEPQVLLDGFGNHANAHNLANGFAWGPDGWLYGTHGRTNWSLIGKPAAPAGERIRFDGGVYRYHPVRHVWEPFADGTTNPWGIDFDDYGEGFVCNCVNPHLFHVIQGAHYEPWRNRKSSEFAYQRIDTIADHLHFLGGESIRKEIGSSAELAAGGGHAHCGTMVYLGDNWPDRYRNTVFMNNIHGRRINNDKLRRHGSGYTASHSPDVMVAKDPWFMGVTLQYGPDGAVFVIDWSDTGECHSVRNTRRNTGRIYKISYGKPNRPIADVAALNDQELFELQGHRNDWYVRHARRLLQKRAAAGRDMSRVHHKLTTMFQQQTSIPRRLRALWALHVTGGIDDELLIRSLDDQSEYVRSWAVRLLCEDGDPPRAARARFRELAASGESQFVRLQLASALQRLEPDARWPIAEALVGRAADAGDENLPLMTWYGIEPLVHEDVKRFVAIAGIAQIPLIRRHVARRVTSLENYGPGLSEVIALLADSSDEQSQLDVLAGIGKGLEGRRTVPMPKPWPGAYRKLQRSTNGDVRNRSHELALVFDDPTALRLLRKQTLNTRISAKSRNRAIDVLVAKKDKDLPPLLLQLVADRTTRDAALRGLAEYEHDDTASTILAHYQSFDQSARQAALQTLASRRTWAMALLKAIQSQTIPRTDLSAFTVRQLQNLGDDALLAKVKSVWGEVQATSADKKKLIATYKKRLSPSAMKNGDLAAGRALFQTNCASCHRLFDAGATIGPDITGSQRKNLDYILENIIAPSATVAKDYQIEIVETTDGRVISGLVVSETKTALTVQTSQDKLVIPVGEIASRSESAKSMMPDGLLQKLTSTQVRDLIAYLRSDKQIPLEEKPP